MVQDQDKTKAQAAKDQDQAQKDQKDQGAKDRGADRDQPRYTNADQVAAQTKGNPLADTDLVDRTERSIAQVGAKDPDPTAVIDREHVEVADGDVVVADPTVAAPGTLLPKDPGEPPQGSQPGRHVPAPQRLDSEGRPLN
jgi:hypothetical protein